MYVCISLYIPYILGFLTYCISMHCLVMLHRHSDYRLTLLVQYKYRSQMMMKIWVCNRSSLRQYWLWLCCVIQFVLKILRKKLDTLCNGAIISKTAHLYICFSYNDSMYCDGLVVRRVWSLCFISYRIHLGSSENEDVLWYDSAYVIKA